MATLAANRAHSPFAVFRHPAFRLLWTGQLVSTAGSALTSLAASIVVYRLTGSALSVGLMLVATALPSLVVGFFAGVVVDRYDRKTVMIASDLTRAAIVCLIPMLLAHGIIWLYVLVMCESAITQFFDPAEASVLPDIATDEELTAANALMQISTFGSTAVGFAASGLIAATLPISWAFYLDAVSFVFSAGCIALAGVPPLHAVGPVSLRSVFDNVREGGAVVGRTPVLRSLFLLFIPVSLSFGLTNALLLPFSQRALHATSFQYGLQEGLTSVGFVACSLLLVNLGQRIHEGQWLAVSFIGMALPFLWYALTSSVVLAITLVMITGFFNAPAVTARAVLIQRHTPREARGRVFSTFFVIRNVVFVFGMAAAGLADLMNVRLLMLVGSLILLVAGGLALVMPGLRDSMAQWRRSLHLLLSAEPMGERIGRALGLTELEQIAQHLPALARLSPAHRQLLLAQARLHELTAGERILEQGRPDDGAYVLLSGRAVAASAATVTTNAHYHAHFHALATLHPGDVFGNSLVLTRGRHVTDVVAREACSALELPAALLESLRRDPDFDRQVRAMMTERLAHAHAIDHPRSAAVNHHLRAGLRLHRRDAPRPLAVAPGGSGVERAGA